jgi:hypothetical protein
MSNSQRAHRRRPATRVTLPRQGARKPGTLNLYLCPRCKGVMVTQHLALGVTPVLLPCLATADCVGTAGSQGYPPRLQGHREMATHYWYRPTGEELDGLDETSRAYVDRGGLLLVARAAE